MKRTAKVSPQEDFDNRLKKYNEEEKALLKKYQISKRLIVNFRSEKKITKPPLLSRLCMSFVSKSGGFLDIQFFNLKK
jgi:hypothetical protein